MLGEPTEIEDYAQNTAFFYRDNETNHLITIDIDINDRKILEIKLKYGFDELIHLLDNKSVLLGKTRNTIIRNIEDKANLGGSFVWYNRHYYLTTDAEVENDEFDVAVTFSFDNSNDGAKCSEIVVMWSY